MSKKLKNIYATLVVILLIMFLAPQQVLGVELPVKAESAILIDAHSGKILYEKDPHKTLPPASVTKLMTLVLAMEAIKEGKASMNDEVIASPNAASYGGSQIYLAPGEKLTLKELLLGIALASGNDASVAVAEHIAGTHEAFVDMMNKKAAELGLKNTHFVNCNGLHDPNHYTSAYDLAQIALYALRYPELRELCSVKHYRIREGTDRPFQYDNKNKLLWQYPGTDGFKTGWTNDAKYCLAATVERNGLRFVSVVMGSPEKSGHFADTKILWNWGYSQYTFKQFHKENEIITQVKVGKGQVDSVAAIPEKKVGITLPKGQDKNLTTQVTAVPILNAPVKAGQVVGHISILKDGEIIERVNLVAKDSVDKGSWWREFSKVVRGVVTG
ncbi:MAG: D-alanyl-D-alanine carboxypeptidase family protein [Bacillota bacterium]|uniref:serine-type D-Ala-D-Ala carboxypeptidase n=1 Tax=Thermanaerosceptrum fracticalcis TaxID=1712410 RepID=A0A7G6E0G4_THEFR|nr:D-alanyl-D-alanine carboxypeptidase family protein [Thermanaerosceptrum fracticalcis]QNB45568.1 D-alanyl-D-alanine carboxypeptidase [Thermanaerosceptrum fracticalcis]